MRVCRKNTGPRESSLISDRDDREARARARSARSARRRCRAPASGSSDERASRNGGRLTSGSPSTPCDADVRRRPPRRGAGRCRSARRGRAASGRGRPGAPRGSLRERDEHAVDVEAPGRAREARDGAPSMVRSPRSSRRSRGCVVDEPDEIDPVLGMLQVLARDELADRPGADDDRVLHVLGPPPADRPGSAPRERDQRRSRTPRTRSSSSGRARTGRSRDRARYETQTATVTRWKTPTTSSTVEWSVRSSSRSYSL